MHDPAAAVESDNFSSPLSTFNGTFDPTANGGLLGFYNDTGQMIVALSLHTIIAPGLTTADIGSSFVCNSGTDNPFFLSCGFDYDVSNGSLTIRFFGVNPGDDDDLSGSDSEVGEREGIPPVSPLCLLHPESEGCNLVGHFAFVFNNDFRTAGNVSNGWNPDTTSSNSNTPLFDGPPVFDSPGYTLSPEPGAPLLLGGGLLALAALSRLRVRRR